MKKWILFTLLLIMSCTTAPKNDISMYEVSSEMKRNDAERAQKETIQSAPAMKKKEYSPAETVMIAGFGVAGFASQIAYIEIMKKEKAESDFYSSTLVPTNDFLMVKAEVALPEERKLSLCVMNLNCSEALIKSNKSDGIFFSIGLPGLGE